MSTYQDKIVLSKDKLNIIVAYTSEHRYISCENDLPWKRKLKADKNFMKQIIKPVDGAKILVIMGRVTYETCPKIPGVDIAVITSNKEKFENKNNENVFYFKKLEEALEFGKNHIKVIFGGENIYREALNYDHRLFCTVINDSVLSGDRIFPNCNTPLVNINKEVDQFLLSRGIKKTWEFVGDEMLEDGYIHNFYMGESSV